MDLSLSQLIIVAAVAVIVLGPRQAAQLAFSAGRMCGRARSMLSKLRRELEGETAEVSRGFRETGAAVSAAVNQARNGSVPRFTASYAPAALSSAALQQEICMLKNELEALRSSARSRRCREGLYRRHSHAKRSTW